MIGIGLVCNMTLRISFSQENKKKSPVWGMRVKTHTLSLANVFSVFLTFQGKIMAKPFLALCSEAIQKL